MKNPYFILAAIVLLLCAPTSGHAQGWQWARDAADSSGSSGTSAATDKWGNVYVAGSFLNSISFGAVTVTSPYTYNVFLTKYDSLGNVLWVKYANSPGGTNYRVASDLSGNIYLTGHYHGSITFGDITLTSSGLALFLAKYDTGGSIIWAKSTGHVAEGGLFYPTAVSTDGKCNIYVAGGFGGDNLNLISATGSTDTLSPQIFIFKYDSTGNLIWAKGESDTFKSTEIHSIAIDRFDNIYVTGICGNNAIFDTIAFASLGQGMFLAKYDTAGHIEWLRGGGGWATYGYAIEADNGRAVTTDLNGNVYVAGTYDSTVTFGDSTFLISGQAVFLVKYDSAGNALWARSTHGGYHAWEDYPYGMATDALGNIYLAGTYDDTFGFGGIVIMTASDADIFLVKFDSDGNASGGAVSSGGSTSGFAEPVSVNVDLSGNAYITGGFMYEPTLAFGGTILPDGSSNGTMFIAKYSNNAVTPVMRTSQMSLYPNPATDALNLQYGTSSHWITDIAIYDMLGRGVLERHLDENNPGNQTVHIQLPLMEDGMYLLKARNADGVECLRFVVKR